MRNAPNVDKPDETYDLTCDNEKHGVDYQGEGLESVSFNYCISNKSPFLKHFIFQGSCSMESHSATSATTLKYNTGKRIRCGKKGKVGGGCIVIESVSSC